MEQEITFKTNLEKSKEMPEYGSALGHGIYQIAEDHTKLIK